MTASHLTITFTRSDAGERKFYLQSWSTLDSKLIEQKIRRHKNSESRCWAKTDHLIPSLLRDEAAQNKNWIMLFMDKWDSCERENRHSFEIFEITAALKMHAVQFCWIENKCIMWLKTITKKDLKWCHSNKLLKYLEFPQTFKWFFDFYTFCSFFKTFYWVLF